MTDTEAQDVRGTQTHGVHMERTSRRPPTVSFVVPCYKLAHLLGECVDSILAQTFGDLEVLIMDDCSPDDTAEVARAYTDPRVIHVRNDPNLGHLRNYNKGIELARGKYVWLISADDYLRRPYVVERYVKVMEANPRIAYAFCAGVGVRDGVETPALDYSLVEDRDRVIPGRSWLKRQLRLNLVLAASGLVRRDLYEKCGAFPLDMPWAGDWYLWCLLALYGDVAFFAEPMVCYREHPLSMTNTLTQGQAEACAADEIAIPWRIKAKADAAGYAQVSRDCLRAVTEIYERNTAWDRFGMSTPILNLEKFEESLRRYCGSERERDEIRARVFAALGSRHDVRGEALEAGRLYKAALEKDPWMLKVQVKRALLALGPAGAVVRKLARAARGADGRSRSGA